MKMLKIVSAAVAGNVLEVYDMVIYGFFASTIAEHFFPKQDKLTGIASTFAIFFIGYLARPLGAILFGRMGDTLGRKPALLSSIWLMAFSTCALGLLPTYQAIGMWAPLLLLILRILQGFSVGGELTGCTVFIIEHAPPVKRGFHGSFSVASANLGFLLASLVAWLINTNFSQEAVIQWAWRLPFLFGFLIGFTGFLMRRTAPETKSFLENVLMPQTYLSVYRQYAKQLRYVPIILGMVVFGTVLTYLIYVFSITYMSDIIMQYTKSQALSINTISIILLVLLIPCIGKLGDQIGRRPVATFGLIGGIIWVWPYFLLLQQHSVPLALLAQGIMTLFAASYFTVVTVIIVEIVPVQLRFSVVAFTYALGASIFGGAAPLIATLLLKLTHSYISLVLYLLVCALISLIAVYKVKETKGIPLS